MTGVILILGIAALVGHAALWVGFVNRVHATAAPRWLVKGLSGAGHTALTVLPLFALYQWSRADWEIQSWRAAFDENTALRVYVAICWIAVAIALVGWLSRHLWLRPMSVRSHGHVIDIAERLGRKPVAGKRARLLSYIPGNQVWTLEVREIEVPLERLPPALDGLSITLLSDLHFTGRIDLGFFHEVVAEANSLESDLIAVCGDIADKQKYFEWIAPTLGRLTAPSGVYYILGNHDLFAGDVPRLRRVLGEAGLVDLGGRWRRLSINAADVIVAGNELPWLGPAADMEHCEPRLPQRPELRLLLSHTPDQLEWARRWDFDLMLAGHTHGGQIRLPVVGPIFTPCRSGVKYASGNFYARPTVMHVSRGVSAEFPLRLWCRPELTKIVLRCAAKS